MGVLKINYSELAGAIKNAEKAAKEADSYAEGLEKKVCKKIADLEGGSSGNVNNADYFVKKKIGVLKAKSEKLKNFAGKLSTFEENCKEADKDVGAKFSALYSQFKKDNGFKISIVSEFFCYLGTKILNSTEFGKWLNNTIRSINDFFNDIWGEIKYLYKCEGGKYVVDIVLSVAAIALAVVTIITTVVTIITAGAGFFAIVTIIGAIISIVNAINNICTSAAALHYNDEDPAWANRYGEMDKLTDTLRKRVNNRFADVAANALDAIEAFCDIVGLIKVGTDLSGNISEYKEIFKDGKASTLKKWFDFGKKTFKDQFANDFKKIGDFKELIKTSETMSNGLKALNYTISALATIGAAHKTYDRITEFKPNYLDKVNKVIGLSYKIEKFSLGITPKLGIYYDSDKPGVLDLEFGVENNFKVDIEFKKKSSAIQKIRDVFNPKNYASKYGITSMTPTDKMLDSMGAFVQ